MSEWITDPKSIALISGAAVQLVITVWHSKQTARLVDELVDWKSKVIATLAELETKVETHGKEIDRLRGR